MAQTFIREEPTTQMVTGELDVELRHLFKFFGGEPAVNGVSLGIRKGEFFSMLGPSGCGKTTILRTIAGFETPSAGEVWIQNQLMNPVPAYRRPVNTVFQSYALFNHLTVEDNIAFGLRLKKLPREEISTRVEAALAGVQMERFAKRFPAQLSGGQRQRVALARALINRPAVVLLDEPLGALDLKLRKEMQVELSNLHQELGLTFIMVTHDQEEALSLSDRLAVMKAGRVEQVGSPQEIYDRPRTAFVADFIGDTNLFPGKINAQDYSTQKVITGKGLSLIVAVTEPGMSGEVVVSVRPEKIKLSESGTDEENCFEARLKNVMYLGTRVQYVVELKGTGDRVMVMQSTLSESIPSDQDSLFVSWRAEDSLALIN